MPRSDEITSTEKLLNVIRKQKDELSDNILKSPNISPGKPFQLPRIRIIPLRKSINVGIDIGPANLRLVKTQKSFDNKWKLLDFRNIQYPSSLSKGTPEFAFFLKTELIKFCGTLGKTNLWVTMSAAGVEVRHVRIPRVERKEIENAVFWTFMRESPFDEKESIFDFEIQGEVIEQDIPKYSVMAYTAPKQEVEEIKKLFSEIGMDLAGISIIPFAAQNIFRAEWMQAREDTVASLFIGSDFSRIDIYARGNLVMTRDIKAGTNSMIEALMEGVIAQNQSGSESETVTPNREEARKILFSLSEDSLSFTEGDVGFGLKKEKIFAIIKPALERLVRQVERTFEYFTINLGNKGVNRIYVSSVMNLYRPIVDYFGNQLGMQGEVLDPLSIESSYATLQNEASIISVSERAEFIPALGLALSDNINTPNLAFTYKDKEREIIVTHINQAVFAGFIVVALICSIFFGYQVYAASQKKVIINRLQQDLAKYNPRVDQNMIMRMMVEEKKRQQRAKIYNDRYAGMAIISELSTLTPNNIHLTSLKINMGTIPSGKIGEAKGSSASLTGKGSEAKTETVSGPVRGASEGESGTLVMEGVIFGDRRTLDSSLAGYVVKLQSSSLFHQISVQKNSVQNLKKADILEFTINLKIG